MTDEWFSEYVYEVVVDKRLVTAEVLDVMQQEPVVLPPWDPMGSLAQVLFIVGTCYIYRQLSSVIFFCIYSIYEYLMQYKYFIIIFP